MVCYAINDRNSFKNACSKWLNEIKNTAQAAPCILVGTKSDIRKQAEDQMNEEMKTDGMSKLNPNEFVGADELLESAKKYNF